MEIRFYQEDDLEIAVEIFRELSDYYLGDKASSKEEIAKNLENNILAQKSGVKLLLGIEDGKAVCMATISLLYPAPKETGQLFIKEVFVAPKHQSNGKGKKLVSFIAQYAQKSNCSRLDLTVDTDNEKALSFYKRLGMQILDTKQYLRANHEVINQLAKSM